MQVLMRAIVPCVRERQLPEVLGQVPRWPRAATCGCWPGLVAHWIILCRVTESS